MTVVDGELVAVLDLAPGLVDVREVEAGVDTEAEEVERQRDEVDVPRPLAVAEQRPLDTLAARHEGELGGGHRAAAVVVGVDREHDRVPPGDVAAEPLELVGVDVRRRHLDRRGQVDDRLPVGPRLPDVQDRLADLEREVHLGAGEALRRVLEPDLGAGKLVERPQAQVRAARGDVDDAGAILAEDDAPLQLGRRVVEVDDGALRAPDALDRALDELLATLREHLDPDVVRDEVLLDQQACEVVVRLRGGREADLHLLEAEPHEQIPEAPLPRHVHGVDEGLVPVAQVDRAPDRGPLEPLLGPRPVRELDTERVRPVALERHAHT